MAETIICPKCKSRIPLDKALTAQIEDDLRRHFEADAKKREQEANERYEQRLAAELSKLEKQSQKKAGEAAAEMVKLQRQIAEAQDREKAAEKRFERRLATEVAKLERQARKQAEQEMASQLAELEKQVAEAQHREKAAQASYEQRLATEISKIEEQAKKKAEEAAADDLAKLRKQLRQKDQQLVDIRKQEQELQEFQSQLEAREEAIDSEVARKTDRERRKIQREIAEKAAKEYDAREREHAKERSDFKRTIAELNRKLEQTQLELDQASERERGTAAEKKLEDELRKNFPYDQIEPVRKGKKGADVIQRVCTQSGQLCGTIVWESKKAETWSKGWLSKLRSDQRREKAELAVLVSKTLPKDVSHFACIEGIWVTGSSLVVGVAMALRTNLIQVAMAKSLAAGKNVEIKEMLYDYVTGTEFKQRVEAIIEAFRTMQDDLQREKRATERNWANRENQIDLVIKNIAGMYGDIQGMGATLPKIRRLELLPAPQGES